MATGDKSDIKEGVIEVIDLTKEKDTKAEDVKAPRNKGRCRFCVRVITLRDGRFCDNCHDHWPHLVLRMEGALTMKDMLKNWEEGPVYKETDEFTDTQKAVLKIIHEDADTDLEICEEARLAVFCWECNNTSPAQCDCGVRYECGHTGPSSSLSPNFTISSSETSRKKRKDPDKMLLGIQVKEPLPIKTLKIEVAVPDGMTVQREILFGDDMDPAPPKEKESS